MAYIPPQLIVDNEQGAKLDRYMQAGIKGLGDMGQARLDAIKLEEKKKTELAEKQKGEKITFAEKGVSADAIDAYHKTGDAKGIQDFLSQNFQDDKAHKQKIAELDANFKKSQIASNYATAKEKNLPVEETRGFKEYVAKKEFDNKNLKQGKNAVEFDSRMQNILGEAEQLKAMIEKNGTFEAFGPHNQQLAQKVDAIAIDAAKLFDPESVARDSEVAAFRKMLFEPGTLTTSNSTALGTVDGFKKLVQDRAGRSRGEVVPGDNGQQIQPIQQVAPVRPEVRQQLQKLSPDQKRILRDQLRQKAMAGN